MNQAITGKLIQESRKEQNLTQRELAVQLGISDKTVSKWETGNGLPEVGLMLPLCEILKISVNELLSGERLDEKNYKIKAEENIMDLMNERKEAKFKLTVAVITCVTTLICSLTLMFLAEYLEMETWLRVVLIVVGAICIISVLLTSCELDRTAGAFECQHCKNRFVPKFGAYLFGMHTFTTRRLRCPKCGHVTWCKKRLNK